MILEQHEFPYKNLIGTEQVTQDYNVLSLPTAFLVDGDGKAADRLLSSDYLGVYTTGFSDRAAYIAALADGPFAASFELSQSRIFVLSETAVMYSYRADFRSQPNGSDEAMYISSLWCLRDGEWVNVFSQDTPSENANP